MKPLAFILIIAGILMLVFRNVSFTHEKKVVDLGPLQIDKKEKKTVEWPMYAGGIAIAAGVILLATGNKKS